MSLPIIHLVALLAFISATFAQYSIGPASFAWPPPRLWDMAFDNVPPCGTLNGSGHRTRFPMDHGYVAFVAQYEAWNVKLSVSFTLDPMSVADFTPVMNTDPLRKLDVGISCFNVPDAPSFVEPGDKATLQIRYFSDYDSPTNQSFFVCADIIYVAPSDILYPYPCVNTTAPNSDIDKGPPAHTPADKKPKGRVKPTKEPKPSGAEWSSGKKTGLSKAAIAGIGISGAVVLMGIVVGFWVQVNKRKGRRLTTGKQQDEVKGESETASKSTSGVRLQDLSRHVPD
ncbi:hypothetical protein V8C37DRAFT_400862 [Trichoderma ceciliae]